MIEVAIRGVLDADGGHSSSGVGGGTRNEPGGTSNTSHWCRNKKWLDILGEDNVGWLGVGGGGGGVGLAVKEGKKAGYTCCEPCKFRCTHLHDDPL